MCVVALHLYTTPSLADIKPAISMLVLDPAHRYSMVWHAARALLPCAPTLSCVAGLNTFIAVLMVLPLVSLLLGLFRDARAALVGTFFSVFAVAPVKFMHSVGPYALLVFCALAAADRLTAWQRTGSRLDLSLAAGCMLSLRPEGAFAVLAVALIALGRPSRLVSLMRSLNAVLVATPVALDTKT